MRIATRLARHRSDRQRQAVVETGGRHAVTRVNVIATYGMPPPPHWWTAGLKRAERIRYGCTWPMSATG